MNVKWHEILLVGSVRIAGTRTQLLTPGTNLRVVVKEHCIVAATRNHVAKSFPNTSSESDLQHYRAVWDRSSRERKSPSLSNVASDRHKVCMLP
jgi:hypothetical protein